MTILTDDNLVAWFKRAAAAPGEFATLYPGVTDDEVGLYLADGFAMAKLDQFFATYDLDINVPQVTPDLSTAGQALVIAYSVRPLLRERILSVSGGATYKAGPVEYSTTTQSNVLTQLLGDANEMIERVRKAVTARITPVVGDLGAVRLMGLSGLDYDQTELLSIAHVGYREEF